MQAPHVLSRPWRDNIDFSATDSMGPGSEIPKSIDLASTDDDWGLGVQTCVWVVSTLNNLQTLRLAMM